MTCKAARAATMVLPEPTSPWIKRLIGKGRARSSVISLMVRIWALVRLNGSDWISWRTWSFCGVMDLASWA